MCALSLDSGWDQSFARDGRCASYGSFGEWKLSLLCKGLGVPSGTHKEAIRVFRLLSGSWAEWPLGATPAWQTDITDDGSPFEFSTVFDGSVPRVRMLMEAQEAPMTLMATWAAGLRLNERLAELPEVDLRHFDRVRDLFTPIEEVGARFALWHAADLDADRRTSYKIYLNPQVRGSQSAKGTVMEALARLGLPSARDFLLPRLSSDEDGTRLAYFSLDLSADRKSRVKVYLAHPGVSADDIEPALEGTQNYAPGDGARWIHQLLGSNGPFQRRPLLTCFSFTGSGGPPSATLHVPIRDYACHDAYSVERACQFLDPEEAKTLRRALGLFACRPLDMMPSILTYVSLRRLRSRLNVTTYLAPEAFVGRGTRRLSSPPSR
jgi:DMATS type aromatic prenyltransferase